MKSFCLLLFITTAYAIPQRRRIDANRFVKEALNTPLIQDASVKAPVDKNSPSAAAALAYMKSVAKDGHCGLPTEVYIQTILMERAKKKPMLKLPKSTLKLITMVKGYQKKEPVLLQMLPGERLG